MSNYRAGIGNVGYIGSPELMVSEANQEIIPAGKTVYKMTIGFMSSVGFHISINGGIPMFLKASQFEMGPDDQWLTSFKIIEDGIQYYYIGAVTDA